VVCISLKNLQDIYDPYYLSYKSHIVVLIA